MSRIQTSGWALRFRQKWRRRIPMSGVALSRKCRVSSPVWSRNTPRPLILNRDLYRRLLRSLSYDDATSNSAKALPGVKQSPQKTEEPSPIQLPINLTAHAIRFKMIIHWARQSIKEALVSPQFPRISTRPSRCHLLLERHYYGHHDEQLNCASFWTLPEYSDISIPGKVEGLWQWYSSPPIPTLSVSSG